MPIAPRSSNEPIVSVIVPAYNARATICETLHSVLQQTLRDIEVIVIDDGSLDDTLAQIATLNDPRLKVFSGANQGHSGARNRGLQEATGEFISFIDADDLWTIDKLEQQRLALYHHPTAGVAYSWTQCIDAAGKRLYDVPPIQFEGDVWQALLLGNFLTSGSNILIRRSVAEAVGYFNTKLSKAEDWEYFLRLAQQTHFVLVPAYQIFYRKIPGSASSKIDEMERCSLAVLDTALRTVTEPLHHIRQQGMANIYSYSADSYLQHQRRKLDLIKALQRLWRSCWAYPLILLERRSQRLLWRWVRQCCCTIGQTFYRFKP
jgi:glycosyltransferase involved in cell wall biosynthesis